MQRLSTTLRTRFDAGWLLDPATGCWIWQRARNKWGYGLLSIRAGVSRGAHQVAWYLTHGVFPQRPQVVLHVCDNPACVNIGHLRLGTQADNKQDSVAKRRHAHGERHGMTTVTDAQAQEMRAARAAGASLRSIAEDYGVCQSTVSNIYRGVTRRQDA